MKTKQISEIERQERNAKLVAREILDNQSMIVEDLLNKDVLNFEDIENLDKSEEELKDEGYTQEQIDSGDVDNPYQEVYEWWLVTEWIYKELKNLGEPVINYNDCNFWWGRCCTGQAIKLDRVIDRIFNKISERCNA